MLKKKKPKKLTSQLAGHTTINEALYLHILLVQRHIYKVWEIYWFGVSLFSQKKRAIQQENFWEYSDTCTRLSPLV